MLTANISEAAQIKYMFLIGRIFGGRTENGPTENSDRPEKLVAEF